MKNASILAICTFMFVHTANATPLHAYAGAISALNIRTWQYSIAQNIFSATRAPISTRLHAAPHPARSMKQARNLYGTMPIYGTMQTYGEYGDDTGILPHGRNGGDTYAGQNIWFDAKYYNGYTRHDHFSRLDSDFGTISVGTTAYSTNMGPGILNIGLYGGYIGGNTENNIIDIDQNAGYIGLYGKYTVNNLSIAIATTGGVAFSNATTPFANGTDDYANAWWAMNTNVTYDLLLDSATALRPGFWAGYTLIGSSDYISSAGGDTSTDTMHLFNVAPGLQMLRHIWGNWYGTIDAKYVFNFNTGGNTSFDDTNLTRLNPRNFSEYGISAKYDTGTTSAQLYLTRRDGGITDWNGGINIKYEF